MSKITKFAFYMPKNICDFEHTKKALIHPFNRGFLAYGKGTES